MTTYISFFALFSLSTMRFIVETKANPSWPREQVGTKTQSTKQGLFHILISCFLCHGFSSRRIFSFFLELACSFETVQTSLEQR